VPVAAKKGSGAHAPTLGDFWQVRKCDLLRTALGLPNRLAVSCSLANVAPTRNNRKGHITIALPNRAQVPTTIRHAYIREDGLKVFRIEELKGFVSILGPHGLIATFRISISNARTHCSSSTTKILGDI
jgi:hypothetical protein